MIFSVYSVFVSLVYKVVFKPSDFKFSDKHLLSKQNSLISENFTFTILFSNKIFSVTISHSIFVEFINFEFI